MFWAEEIANEAKARALKIKGGGLIVIRDEKTVSGRVHVGSMRGAAIHGAVHETLTAMGVQNTFLWEHNDFDPMDDIPTYLDRAIFEPHLGKPLKYIPSPDLSPEALAKWEPGQPNYAEYFAKEFQQVIENAGFKPTFYWGSEWYESGKMDSAIKEALDNAATIRKIYKEVSGSDRKDTWLPINVICPECGKVTTTDATDWDGQTVLVNCYPTKVEYTQGCGFKGRVSPFMGRAKLPWKVEWPAKWKAHLVTVEGGGKDHSTRGGSRDVGVHISNEVFKYDAPLDIPYEFLLVGGKKMSSSKGRGSSAKEIAELIPAKIFRLALLGKDISQQFNFDPEGDTIPVLYDLYDKLAEGYRTTKDDDYAKLFELIHPGRAMPSDDTFMPRFSQVAFIVQMPHMTYLDEVAKLKGSALTDADMAEAKERALYAFKWIKECAPEKFVFQIQETLPEAATGFSPLQKLALAEVLAFIKASDTMPSGETIQQKLFDLKGSLNIPPAELFGALYLAFLGKSYGPKVGWFLSVLPKEFVETRLGECVK